MWDYETSQYYIIMMRAVLFSKNSPRQIKGYLLKYYFFVRVSKSNLESFSNSDSFLFHYLEQGRCYSRL